MLLGRDENGNNCYRLHVIADFFDIPDDNLEEVFGMVTQAIRSHRNRAIASGNQMPRIDPGSMMCWVNDGKNYVATSTEVEAIVSAGAKDAGTERN